MGYIDRLRHTISLVHQDLEASSFCALMQDSAQPLTYSHYIGCLACAAHRAEYSLVTRANRCGLALSIPDGVR